MDTLVIDTSIVIKWLNQDNELHIEEADKILEEAKKGNVELFAPELLKYELGNVLLKGKNFNPSEACVLLFTAYSLPITFISESSDLAEETFTQARLYDVTYYDAAFLALAKKFNAILITENVKHQGKSRDVKVIALKDFSK